MALKRSERIQRVLRKTSLFFFLFFLIACQGKNHKLGPQLPIEKKRLSNGLTVLLLEDRASPVVSFQTWYRVGSVDEKPGTRGLTHLLEHLFFQGTSAKGAKQEALDLEAQGVDANAFTTRDYAVFHSSFPPALLERVATWEADRMTGLTFTEENLNAERMVVFEERRLRFEGGPESAMQEALWQLAFRRHPYQSPIIGYPSDLVSLTLAKVTEYYQNYYYPANATLVVVGDFDRKKTFDLIRKLYEKIPRGLGKAVRDFPEEPTQEEERRYVLRDNSSSQRFTHGYHITAAKDEDSYALDVLANILFEGPSSRAHRALVEKQDLMTSVTGSAYTPTYPGLFVILGVMKKGKKCETGEAALAKVLNELQEKGVTSIEVEKAVKQLTIQILDGLRASHGMAQLLGAVEITFGDPARVTADIEKYLKVKPEDVMRVARSYLIPNNRSVVTLEPKN